MMALRAENISKQFFRASKTSNNFLAVQATDFSLQNGSLAICVGRSGSGKTTLLNMLSGLLTPTTGKVLLDDINLYALPDEGLSFLRSSRIGIIPQGRAALDTLTVMENVLLPCLLQGQKAAGQTQGISQATQRAEALLERLGMSHLTGAMPGELSGGELRRLSIARALVQQPDVILADEPTGDLDDENTKTVLTLLREAADGGAAVLLITHENNALPYADTVWRMNNGQLLPADTKTEGA